MEYDLSNLPGSAAEARKIGQKYYWRGKPCKNGHFAPRRAGKGDNKCLQCDAERHKSFRMHPSKGKKQRQRRREQWRKNDSRREQILKNKRHEYANDPAVRRKTISHGMKYTKGIDLTRYEEILEIQGGKCAICGTTDTGNKKSERFCVDHDHETGAVRGLLCTHCNFLLGTIGEDKKIIRKAIHYINQHN